MKRIKPNVIYEQKDYSPLYFILGMTLGIIFCASFWVLVEVVR